VLGPSHRPHTAAPPASNLPPWLQKLTKDMPTGLLIGIGVGALIIVIAPIFLLLRRTRSSAAGDVTSDLALPPGESYENQLASRAAAQEKLDAEALLALKLPAPGTKKSEVLSKHLKKAVKTDPKGSAQLLRTWMDETS
jgi:flagellar biosynthesis/type III secretory pathway M-ring protein FliF/YscJ